VRRSTFWAGFKERREQRESLKALSSSSELGEAALRTIYSNIEYDDVLDRKVGDTPEETAQAFAAINDQFEDLEQSGSRGGKPYSAEQILPVVSELYLERKDQIDAIVESENPKEAFKVLCAEMIAKDSAKLTERVYTDRNKARVLRALSVASSLFASQFVGMASGLQGASVKPMKWVEKA
jgi:dsDNA-specific endonuclease/ATPase MutS2